MSEYLYGNGEPFICSDVTSGTQIKVEWSLLEYHESAAMCIH